MFSISYPSISTTISPDNGRANLPDNNKAISPDNSKAISPDNSKANLPDNGRANVPDNSTTISLTPKLCLNMIVKNESKVILRLLESVVTLIDYYCICDTGSTDNTKELITNYFMEKGIPGKIIEEPFRDFGYNRSFALKACETIPNMDYILLLDADMVLKGPMLEIPLEFKKGLTADVYHMCQGTATFFYKNVRIVKNYKGYSYWGVTHEFVQTPNGTQYEYLDRSQIFIEDIGDGGAKSDKFERDIRLLKKGLEENPNNDRYTFYLANSLRDAGRTEEAIDMFQKRIDIGGWQEEVWHSYLSIGKCWKTLGKMEKAITTWMDGYQFYPKRIENLYEIIHYYRTMGKNRLAYDFFLIADQSRKEWGASDDYLFLQKDVYDYKIDYELSIIGYYVNYRGIDLQKVNMKVLNDPNTPDDIKRNVLNNYKFYSKKLSDQQIKWNISQDELKWNKNIYMTNFNLNLLKNATKSLNIEESGEFISSTPSICLRGYHLILNQRYVNYRIDDNGQYVNRDKIRTRNAVAIIDISNPIWKNVQEFELKYNKSHDSDYEGLEDIRISINDKNEIVYNANRGLSYHNIAVETGIIDLARESTMNDRILNIENQSTVEKNWVLLPPSMEDEKQKIIYHWYPTIKIGEIDPINNTFMTTHDISVPSSFKLLRGSTNGVKIDDEIWFFCHSVSYEERRYYYHSIVVLDADTYKLKKYTPFFTLEGEKVEYTLGFVYMKENDTLLIGYSIFDNSTKYLSILKSSFENMFISDM